MARLKSRIAIVTGAGQGIGRAIALGMAREGAKIVVADLNLVTAKAVQEEIGAGGGTALAAENRYFRRRIGASDNCNGAPRVRSIGHSRQ